jgi:thiol-disulfide isomerase/thioredoxin
LSESRIPILTVLLLSLVAAHPAPAAEEAAIPSPGGAYGVVLRKQAAGNRVMVQPLEGLFVADGEIRFHDGKGEPVCAGKVQKVYANLLYTVAEGCDRFEEIRTGAGVTFDRDGKAMLARYDTPQKVDEAVRESEWKRSSGIPMEIAEDQFEIMVKDSKVPVVLEIYATWCPHCDRFRPVLGEVAKALEGKVRVATIDEEKCADLKKRLGAQSFPAMFVFSGGKIVDEWRGAYRNRKDTIARIESGLGKAAK